MLLDSIATQSGGISLVWFAGSVFGLAMILLGYIWKQQINQQKEQMTEMKKQTEVIQSLALDIAVMKNNSINTASDVKRIREDLDLTRDEMGILDKRIYKLEVAK